MIEPALLDETIIARPFSMAVNRAPHAYPPADDTDAPVPGGGLFAAGPAFAARGGRCSSAPGRVSLTVASSALRFLPCPGFAAVVPGPSLPPTQCRGAEGEGGWSATAAKPGTAAGRQTGKAPGRPPSGRSYARPPTTAALRTAAQALQPGTGVVRLIRLGGRCPIHPPRMRVGKTEG